MLLTIIICTLLTAAYVLLILAYMAGWARQREFVLPLVYAPRTSISVIIPARNEAANIGACIESILAQKYPEELFEIIVVDDHSEDNTAEIVREYVHKNVRCISLADVLVPGEQVNAYKKAALTAGIAHSHGALIVTTDADCTAPNAWFMHLAAIYEMEQPVMIVAPVMFSAKRSALQLFQLLDFIGMQGITVAAHSLKLGNMSNGANLAFSRQAFDKVKGYEGITHLASGDDYLLMMKMNQEYPGSIYYLKSPKAIVITAPQPNWRSLLQQRVRWASKSGKYNDTRLTLILVLVYLFNVALFSLGIAGFFDTVFWTIVGLMLGVKIVTEYLFIIPVAWFFRREWALGYFPLLQPLHVVYIVLAGFLGFFGKYKWKGRMVK